MSDFPAAEGGPVTEADSRECHENGHATHTINGTDTGACPRCGEIR